MISRWGAPAPSGPPMVVEHERVEPALQPNPGNVTFIMPALPKPTVLTIREQMQARAEELKTRIEGLEADKAELALIERMLEVK